MSYILTPAPISTLLPIVISEFETNDAHEIPTSLPTLIVPVLITLKFVRPVKPIGFAHSAELIRTLFPIIIVPLGL